MPNTPIPASPPEPLTFGHVVTDRDGRPWVRVYEGQTLRQPWVHGQQRRWWTEIKHKETR